MANRDIVAIGTSAGGVDALRYLASTFRADIPAGILVTMHLSRQFPSEMDRILSHAGPLPAQFARGGEIVRKAHIYLAPAGCHLLLDGDRLVLGTGPRENNARPAIDPMLRSVAMCCGGRAIGVVLTGLLADGASGLWAVDRAGGMTVVQDPADAAFPDMPRSALNLLRPDHVVPLARMPDLLDSLAHEPAGATQSLPERLRFEVQVAKDGTSTMEAMDHVGRRSPLTCPDCGGVLWQIEEGGLLRYRCHAGHSYATEVMALALDRKLRDMLEEARCCHLERLYVMEELQQRAIEAEKTQAAEDWAKRAAAYREQAAAIGDVLHGLERLAAQQGALD